MVNRWTLSDWLDGHIFKSYATTKAYYYSKITRLAMSQFRYKTDMLRNPELIERYLWEDGRVMIWYSDILGWVITRCYETAWDINGWAIKWRPVFDMTPDGIPQPNEMGIDDKCVVIYDLPIRVITSNICCKWIDEIAETNETIKMQVFNQRTPLLAIAKNPKQAKKLNSFITDLVKGVRAFVVNTDVTEDLKALNIESPFNVSDLQAVLKTKESEMLEFLGIDSQSQFQKKERLITDEQEANNQILSYLMNDRYESRVKGIEELKTKGLSIEIEITAIPDKSVSRDDELSEDDNNDSKDKGVESDNRG